MHEHSRDHAVLSTPELTEMSHASDMSWSGLESEEECA